MSSFVDNVVTNAGAQLLSEVLLGAKLQPTKIVMGSGYIPSGQTSKTLTAVVTPEAELEIVKKERVDATHVVVGGVFSNDEIESDFYFRELGLYCKAVKEDGTVLPEVLYSYGNAGDAADLIAAYTTGTAIERQIDLLTYVGNDTNVDLSISSGAYVTMADLKSMLDNLQAGSGLPPNDMQTFTAASTESGIKLSFKGPENSYLYGDAAGDTLACVPDGFMIRYSDTAYPVSIDDGELVGVYDIDPVTPVTGEQEVIGLTFGETYYFTAFPFSTEGVYNKSQADANHASCVWSGSKGTINVNVQAYEGFEGVIGEYTITLVDQAASGGQNITQTASGTGVTQIGNLEEGKTYVVTLSDTSTLMADPSEPITIVAGNSYNVTLTYRMKYGTISVDVDTANDFAALGDYNITLVAQETDYENVVKAANGKGVTVFDELIDGRKYKVRLGDTPNFLPPADSDVVTVVGGANVDVDVTYAAGVGSVTVNVSTQPANMPIGTVTISLVPQSGGSTLSQQRSGSGSVTFNNVPVGTYTVTGSEVNHYTFSGGSVSVTGGQNTSHNANYVFITHPLNQSTWEEIAMISESGSASEVFSVGDTKEITANGYPASMEIIGFNHDDLTSGGKAGITFCIKYVLCYDEKDVTGLKLAMNNEPSDYPGSSEGGFSGSDLCAWMNETLFDSFSSELRAVIKSVNKRTSAGELSSSIDVSSMKVFGLSEIEVFGTTELSFSGEGTQYPAFSTVLSQARLPEGYPGLGGGYWLRSPSKTTNGCFLATNSYLAVSPDNMKVKATNSGSYVTNFVVFAFCV